MAARKWTEEQKRKQAERIRSWKPWEKSTGPQTKEGKFATSKNAITIERIRFGRNRQLYYRTIARELGIDESTIDLLLQLVTLIDSKRLIKLIKKEMSNEKHQ